MTYPVRGALNATSGLSVKRLLALALLTASGGLLVSACADNESSLYIRGSKAATDESGVIECSADGTFQGNGVVDFAVGTPTDFTATLVVGNQIVQRGDPDLLRTETSRVQMYEARVRVVDVSGNPLTYSNGDSAAYSIPISGVVDASVDSSGGFGCANVPLLDGGTLQSLRSSLTKTQPSAYAIANVIIKGRTLGGQEVETGEWSFPITVCMGCQCHDVSPTGCCASAPPAALQCDDLDPPSFDAQGHYDCRYLGSSCRDATASLP